jgi:ribose transport system permease protein
MLVGMVAIGWLLERTQMGRRFYAMGFERETARLSGIRVDLLGTLAFISSAVIAGAAGLVLTGRVASASPEAGPPYLIPAFSAAFLGATQLRAGRFNPWGTVIAVLMLGTGDVGLLLAGGPIWTPELFEGVVLIAAVALTAGNSETRERLRLLGERIRNRNVPPAASAGRGKGGTGVIT